MGVGGEAGGWASTSQWWLRGSAKSSSLVGEQCCSWTKTAVRMRRAEWKRGVVGGGVGGGGMGMERMEGPGGGRRVVVKVGIGGEGMVGVERVGLGRVIL